MSTFALFRRSSSAEAKEVHNMTLLDSFDPAAMRKTRHASFILLRENSQTSALSPDFGDGDIKGLLTEGHGVGGGRRGENTHHGGPVLKVNQNEAMVMTLSAIYGKLLVVLGLAFPIAEVFAEDLPLIYYSSFYLYLYIGSIVFILYAYFFLLSDLSSTFNNTVLYFRELQVFLRPYLASVVKAFQRCFQNAQNAFPSKKNAIVEDPPDAGYISDSSTVGSVKEWRKDVGSQGGLAYKFVYTESAGHGSMYLKMGTIIFGIGSMIYSGLEFGQYFELRADCADMLMSITPATRMVFTFLQMYFIFLNSRVSISRQTTLSRFGISHMVATNLCIWLNVLVEETKHTIHHITHEQHHQEDHHIDHDSLSDDYHQDQTVAILDYDSDESHDELLDPGEIITLSPLHASSKLVEQLLRDGHSHHNLVRRAVSEVPGECRVMNLLGDMVSSSAPLLYPCTIEYSLLCASVLYVMWKNIQTESQERKTRSNEEVHLTNLLTRKVRHLYSVDCGRASRGLFAGIFVLVLTLISLILFWVLKSHTEYTAMGFLCANITEFIIYSVGIVTTIIGMRQMRELGFIEEEETDLDNVLLVIAQGGVYMFTVFTLIGGYFTKEPVSYLPLVKAAVTLIQATLQTLYILDGSRRCCKTTEQLEKKSGREMVTFLLVTNLSMWLISTFQTSRASLHIAQQHFYGVWAWTIISHVSMPLGIFYRFHVTVCLGEIWKRAYKLRSE